MGTATLAPADAVVEMIPLINIHAGDNVRQRVTDLDSLAGSIKENGLLSAITVTRRQDGEYDVVAGFRRLAASSKAGLQRIPAIVRDLQGPVPRLKAALAENLNRIALPDIDIGQAIQQLMDLGVSVEDVAKTVQTRPENVLAWADINRLPRKVRRLIEKGQITAVQAYPLTTFLDDAAGVRAVLDHVDSGWEVDRAVTTVRGDQERQEALSAARTKLEASGCRIIDAPQYGTFSANSKTQHLGKGLGRVNMSLRQHAKLPCHAAYISPYADADVMYVCTDKTTHAGVEGSGVPDLKAQRAADRAHKQALREAHAKRAEVIRDAVRAGTVDPDVAADHVLRLSIHDGDHGDYQAAVAMLELPVTGTGFHVERDALLPHAATHAQALRRVALAVAISRGERSLISERFSWRPEVTEEHVRLLQSTGIHAFSPAEKELIRQRTHTASSGAASTAASAEAA